MVLSSNYAPDTRQVWPVELLYSSCCLFYAVCIIWMFVLVSVLCVDDLDCGLMCSVFVRCLYYDYDALLYIWFRNYVIRSLTARSCPSCWSHVVFFWKFAFAHYVLVSTWFPVAILHYCLSNLLVLLCYPPDADWINTRIRVFVSYLLPSVSVRCLISLRCVICVHRLHD